MAQPTVVISINSCWNIVNFRRGILGALRGQGCRVVALAPHDESAAGLIEMGIEVVPLPMEREGVSPIQDLRLAGRYYRALARIRPDLFLGYTVKPNVYGSLAAHALGIPVINNVSGLGTAFIRQGWLTRIVSALYRYAFRKSQVVFFQNRDDQELFLAKRLVRSDQARLLPGSGIDLERFRPAPESDGGDGITFLLIARMLWDKGIGEYIGAARLLRQRYPAARFQLVGFLDVPNRTAVPREAVEQWVQEGLVEYLGAVEDVRPFIAAADCIVLPSYREGLPRTLLEGAAMGKPLIASDVPGCRHIVADGENGHLCAARSAESLAEAMARIAALPERERREMGTRGRRRVEREFDERVVIQAYLDAVSEALASARRTR